VPHLRSSWSKKRVIAELRARAAKAVRGSDRNLVAASMRYFGSMVAARRAAGLSERASMTWSRERVIATLQARAKRGELAVREPLESACVRHFGSVSAARGAANVDGIILAWPKPVLRKALRGTAFNRIRGALARAAARCFGSVQRARESRG
jgi:hypothetical protein